MSEKTTNIITCLLGVITLCAICFFWGRSTIDTTPTIEYIKGETVEGAINSGQFIPTKEEKPRIEHRYPIAPFDSAKYAQEVIADYELKRSYSLKAFDNETQGKLELFPTIQFNKLTGFDYSFTPIIQRETFYKERTIQPFGSISYSTLGNIGMGGGLFYHNLGFEYQYQIGFRNRDNGHSFGLKYKF